MCQEKSQFKATQNNAVNQKVNNQSQNKRKFFIDGDFFNTYKRLFIFKIACIYCLS